MRHPPKGWTNIGDTPSIVMPDGTFLLGYKFKTKMASLNPVTMTWTKLTSKGKLGWNRKQGYVLLPDGSFLSVEVKAHPHSQRYIPKTGKWVDAGDTVVDLRGAQDCCGNCIQYGPKNKCYDPPGETGGSVRRPDGTVFGRQVRSPTARPKAHTAIWTPPSKKGRQDGPLDSPVPISRMAIRRSTIRYRSCRTETCWWKVMAASFMNSTERT